MMLSYFYVPEDTIMKMIFLNINISEFGYSKLSCNLQNGHWVEESIVITQNISETPAPAKHSLECLL